MNNPFLKRLMKDNKEDIFHSTVFAQSQNTGSMGAASSRSFNDRMKANRDRKVIKGYGESSIMNNTFVGGQRPKTSEPPKNQ